MADDPTKPPEVPTPPAPPVAAGDKPASASPTEPLKAEVSRTDSPGAGVSAAPPKLAAPDAPQPANPAAATTATTAAASSVTAAPAKPAAAAPAKPAAPAAARPAAAGAAKPAAAEHPPKAAAPTGPSDPPPPADLPVPAFITALRTALPSAVTGLSYFVGDWTVLVSAAQILDVARFLRSSPEALFDLCSDLTASDWPPRPERFDVVYCLFSTRHRHRVRVKAKVADNQPIASVTSVWPAAGWLEREVFDMFGVQFSGHPDLRRILMPEDWQGYPQRKDYPLEGPGELLMENPLDWLKLRQAKEEAEIE